MAKLSEIQDGSSTVEEENKLQTQAGTALSTYRESGDTVGEWEDDEVATPYLTLVQKTSKISDDFPFGNFVLDKTLDLGPEIKFIALRNAKSYIEDLEYGDSAIPKTFLKASEARAAGFNIGKQSAEPRVVEVASVIVAIVCDSEHATHVFTPEEGEPVGFALGLWQCRSTAYGKVAIPLRTARDKGHLREEPGLWAGLWTCKSEKRSSDKGNYVVPSLRSAGLLKKQPNGEALVNWVADNLAL